MPLALFHLFRWSKGLVVSLLFLSALWVLGFTGPLPAAATLATPASTRAAPSTPTPTLAVSLAPATPLASTAGARLSTLVIGQRMVAADEVKKMFGEEPMTFTEREILFQGRSLRYYDVTFERQARQARMIGQIPSNLSLDGVPAEIRVEGFSVYFRTNTTSLAIPLLWAASKYSLPAVPALVGVQSEGNDSGREQSVDWQVGLFDPRTGERLAYYGGYRQHGTDNPLVFDLSTGQFSVCSAFPCGRAYLSAPMRFFGDRVYTPVERRDIRFLHATPEDVAFFDSTLALLKVKAPRWWQYIIDGAPFVAVVDPSLASMGWSGAGSCCSGDGYGWIAWVQSMAEPVWPFTVEGMRVNFWAVLVHEITHVRDLREGRFGTGVERCQALERSALTKELEFARDLLSAKLNEPGESRSSYGQAIDAIIEQRKQELAAATFEWDPQCH